MLFAVDAHALGRRLTGNEVYVRGLLDGFAALGEDAEFIAYVSTPEPDACWPRCRLRRVSPNPFVRLGYDLARCLRQDAPDVLHVQYTAPLACRAPVVVSVHDVSFLEHPEYFPHLRAAQLRWTVSRTVHAAARVITGSDFARDSILRAWPRLDPGKVVVIPNAASPRFRPLSREAAARHVRGRFGIGPPFLLTVGDLQPRKNHINLIEGFARMLRGFPQIQHHLVLAGKDTWFSPRVRQAVRDSGIADRIHLIGFVDDDDLPSLYNACDAFVFPSFYEGFGLPPLEAMACGRAVACSRSTATAELARGAALLFDPYSPAEIAGALADLLWIPTLRRRLERLGSQRAAAYSWKRTAARTLAVYYEVAGGRARVHGSLSSAPVSP